jgi:hypothetical protein
MEMMDGQAATRSPSILPLPSQTEDTLSLSKTNSPHFLC